MEVLFRERARVMALMSLGRKDLRLCVSACFWDSEHSGHLLNVWDRDYSNILGVTIATTLHSLFGSMTDTQTGPQLSLDMTSSLYLDLSHRCLITYTIFWPKRPQIQDAWPIFAAYGPPDLGLPAVPRLWAHYFGSFPCGLCLS
jgi:hypothetical protein